MKELEMFQKMYDSLSKGDLFILLTECITYKNKYDDIPVEILLFNSFYHGEELSKYELKALKEYLNRGLVQINKQLNDLKILEELK